MRDAYRERALRLHPDRQRDATPAEREEAARLMGQINEAWRVLGDPTLRAAYDADLARADRTRAEPQFRPPSADDDDVVVDAAGEEWAPAQPRGLVAQYLPVALLLLGVFLLLLITAYAR